MVGISIFDIYKLDVGLFDNKYGVVGIYNANYT